MSDKSEDRASISFVTMTWNRNGKRLHNLLSSLLVHQDVKPNEVVVVDTSPDERTARKVAVTVSKFPNAKLVRREMKIFNKCWALNIGIQAANPQSLYVGCLDVDFMYSRNFVTTVMQRFHDGAQFVMIEAVRLRQMGDVDPFTEENWARLCEHSEAWGPSLGRGSAQIASRKWWFEVHGYDESLSGGLGGMDTDVHRRAEMGGLTVSWIFFGEAQALHQWHDRSPLKSRTTKRFKRKKRQVMANRDGWGVLPKDGRRRASSTRGVSSRKKKRAKTRVVGPAKIVDTARMARAEESARASRAAKAAKATKAAEIAKAAKAIKATKVAKVVKVTKVRRRVSTRRRTTGKRQFYSDWNATKPD